MFAAFVRTIFVQLDADAALGQVLRSQCISNGSSRTVPLESRWRTRGRRGRRDGLRHPPAASLARNLVQERIGAGQYGNRAAHQRRRHVLNDDSVLQLVGVILAKQHDERQK